MKVTAGEKDEDFATIECTVSKTKTVVAVLNPLGSDRGTLACIYIYMYICIYIIYIYIMWEVELDYHDQYFMRPIITCIYNN